MKILTDENGNALGGIRTPHVDVPIAALKPGNTDMCGSILDNMMCGLFGSTEPFSSEKLKTLYPTHADYVQKYTDSANQAHEAGFVLEPELEEIIAQAEAAQIPPE